VSPSGFRLPPRDIVPPRNMARSTLRIMGPIVVVVVVALLVVAHNSAAAVGGAIAVAVIGLILVVEVPILLRRQRDSQVALTARLPDGGIYSSRAALYPPPGAKGLPASGVVVFNEDEVRFTARKDGSIPTTWDWSAIARIGLGPAARKIGVGRLTLHLSDGSTRTFDVPNYGGMAEILQKHP
jgi:hypothetical protein